jgi:hypothetical protein
MKKEIKQQLQQQGYLAVSEMASELGISISTLKVYLKKKIIPTPTSIDRVIYFDNQQVLDFLNHKKENK